MLGPSFLLQALAAAVIGRMERLPTIAIAAIGIGIVDQAMTFQPGNRPPFNDAVLFVIVLVALLLTKRPSVDAGRRRLDLAGRPRGATDPARARPAPRGPLRALGARRADRSSLLLTLPLWLSRVEDQPRRGHRASSASSGISLVVLTGWAGQVSLGQMAFVGIGAAVGGALTANQGWDIGARAARRRDRRRASSR